MVMVGYGDLLWSKQYRQVEVSGCGRRLLEEISLRNIKPVDGAVLVELVSDSARSNIVVIVSGKLVSVLNI